MTNMNFNLANLMEEGWVSKMTREGDLTAERRESVEVSRVALVIDFDEESRFRDSHIILVAANKAKGDAIKLH